MTPAEAAPPESRGRQAGPGIAVLVNIDVGDLPLAERFYCAAFGLTPGRRFGAEALELLGAAVPLYLLLQPAGSAAGAATPQRRDYARHWTPVHLDFAVPDLDAALARAEAAGAVRDRPVATHAWGRIVTVADPFGNGICLIQFHGRGYDEIADAPAGS